MFLKFNNKKYSSGICLSLSLLGTLLNPVQAKADRFDDLSRYEPLAGSAWAREYPGWLPYDECRIMAPRGQDLTTLTMYPLVYGVESPFWDVVYLTCISEEVKLAYQIPVVRKSILHLNPMTLLSQYVIPSMQQGMIATDIRTSGMNRKTVRSLFNYYHGAEIGLILFMGPNGWITRSKEGIRMSGASIEGGLHAHVGYIRSSFSPSFARKEEAAAKLCKENFSPYALWNGTDATAHEHCDEYTELDESDILPGTSKIIQKT